MSLTQVIHRKSGVIDTRNTLFHHCLALVFATLVLLALKFDIKRAAIMQRQQQANMYM